MSDEYMTKQEVETMIDRKLEDLKNERMRNQRMLNSLQEEVEKLREEVAGKDSAKKGKREKIELEHKVMRAVAEEIERSRKNVADPDAVVERVSEEGYLKSIAKLKIDELVEHDMLIRQSSGDLVFMDPDFEDISFLESHYDR